MKSGWNSARYSFSTAGLSRAGSHVIMIGSSTSPHFSRTLSYIKAILSSSSGQMSGQCVKPKYTSEYLPNMSLELKTLASWSTSENGPPTFGLPTPLVCSAIRLRAMRSFSYVKYAHRPPPVAMKRSAAVMLKGPPLLRALIWSMVVSFWREDVCEKGRRGWTDCWAWRRHVRDGALGALEANVRAAMRGAELLLSAVAMRAVHWRGAAIVCGLRRSDVMVLVLVVLQLFGSSMSVHGLE